MKINIKYIQIKQIKQIKMNIIKFLNVQRFELFIIVYKGFWNGV